MTTPDRRHLMRYIDQGFDESGVQRDTYALPQDEEFYDPCAPVIGGTPDNPIIIPERINGRLVDYASSALSATVQQGSGGSGYNVGDLLQPVGGDPVNFDGDVPVGQPPAGALVFNAPVVAIFAVDTTDPATGAVLTVTLFCLDCSPGIYVTPPANPANTITNGSGVGCRLNIVWDPNGVPVYATASDCCYGATSYVLQNEFPPFGLPNTLEFQPQGVHGVNAGPCVIPHCPDNLPCPKQRIATWNGSYWEGTVHFCGVSLDVQIHYVANPAPGDSHWQYFVNWTTDGPVPVGFSTSGSFSDTTTGTQSCVYPIAVSWQFDEAHLGCGFIFRIKGQCMDRHLARQVDWTTADPATSEPIYAIAKPPCPSGGDCADPCCKDIKSWPGTLHATFTGLTPPITVPLFLNCSNGGSSQPMDSCRCNINYYSATGDGICADGLPERGPCDHGIFYDDGNPNDFSAFILDLFCMIARPQNCGPNNFGPGWGLSLQFCPTATVGCSLERSGSGQGSICGALDLWFDNIAGGPVNVTF